MHITLLKEEKGKYKHRAIELEKRVKELQKGMKSRDGLIESLEDSVKKLKEDTEQLTVSKVSHISDMGLFDTFEQGQTHLVKLFLIKSCTYTSILS